MNPSKSFQAKIEVLLTEHHSYAAEGYFFLRDTLEIATKSSKKVKKNPTPLHISAGELLEAFRIYALKEFGPMAVTVFDYWGIRSCEDVGQMVFHLVQKGIFSKTEQDTIEAFRNCYDFNEAFVSPFLPKCRTSLEIS